MSHSLAAASLSLLAALFLTPAVAEAGPWVKSTGELYGKVAVSTFSSADVFDLDGELFDPGFTYSNQTYALYAEAGLTKRLALNVNLPVILSVNELSERVRVRNNGLGDLDVSLQAQLYDRGRCPVSARLTARAPLYPGIVSDGATPGTTGAEPEPGDPQGLAVRFAPALGDGSYDITPAVSFGCGLSPVPGWFGVEVGPNIRLRGFGDGFVYSGDVGVFVWPRRVAVTGRVAGQQRFRSEHERPTKYFVSFAGGLIVNIARGFALEATATWVPIGGFVARGWTYGAGVSFNGRIFSP
ncbi:MAG: hypothetical protein AAGI01_03725 [Myxococcota bacterium]